MKLLNRASLGHPRLLFFFNVGKIVGNINFHNFMMQRELDQPFAQGLAYCAEGRRNSRIFSLYFMFQGDVGVGKGRNG